MLPIARELDDVINFNSDKENWEPGTLPRPAFVDTSFCESCLDPGRYDAFPQSHHTVQTLHPGLKLRARRTLGNHRTINLSKHVGLAVARPNAHHCRSRGERKSNRNKHLSLAA